MNIYISSETNFQNNGLGFLTDTISAVVHDELNGNYELNIEYVKDGNLSQYLVEENIIKCKVKDGTKQLFRITNVEKTFKTIKITARHIFYDLLNNFLADAYPQTLSAQPFLQYLLNHTNFETNFTAVSDITNTKTARYIRINPVQAIIGDIDNSMVNLFGGELKRDNYTINFLSRVGQNNGVKLLIGKNITGINVAIDITDLATRVMPQGYDGLLLPELYVDSALINNYPTPKVITLEFSDIKYDPNDVNAYHTLEDAYAALRNRVREQYSLGLDKPKINININWIELSKTEEYKQYSNLETVNLGDTITAEILGLNYETRVISIDYNVLKDMVTNFQIGTFRPTIASQMNSLQQKVDTINPTSILEDAKATATQMITTAMGGYIYKTQNELYIMDTDDPTTATKIWRWNINGLGYSSSGINGPYGLAMTMDGAIVADFITAGTLNTNVIQGYGSLTSQVQDNTAAIGDRTGKTSTITQDISSIQAQISDIADITTSSSSNEAIIPYTELQQVANSFPIRIEIHPIVENISSLYPSTSLYPSETLYPKIRQLKFTNVSTNEVFTYTLPTDLLYYDENNYDEFLADYESDLITITKRCQYNSDGTVGLLPSPQIITYDFSNLNIYLTEGNYQVEMPGYNTGFLFVRLMVLNAYTAQYATKVELNSAITQTVNNITSEVSQNYATKTTTNSLSTRISQTVRSISLATNDNGTSCGLTIRLKNEDGTELSANQANITLSGLVKFSDLSGSGTTTINGANITTGTLNADKVSGGTLSSSSISVGSSNYYLRMGTNWTRHPEVSGLNVTGNGGINVKNLGFNSDGSRFTFAGGINTPYLNVTSDLIINGDETCYGVFKTNQIKPGGYLQIATGGRTGYGTNSGSIYMYASAHITLNAAWDHYVYIGNANVGNARAATSSSGPSSRCLKKNITEFNDKEYDDALTLLNEIKLYDYRYKYNIHPKKDQFGFMIDDLLDNELANKFFYFKDEKAGVNKNNYLDYYAGVENPEKMPIINFKRYDEETLIKYLLVVCKALQQKVNKMEEKYESRKTNNN